MIFTRASSLRNAVAMRNKFPIANFTFWSIINGSQNASSREENKISVVQDCFKAEHFKTMSIHVWGKSFIPPHFTASVDFRCNQTSGTQRFTADSLPELFHKLEAFGDELASRNKEK